MVKIKQFQPHRRFESSVLRFAVMMFLLAAGIILCCGVGTRNHPRDQHLARSRLGRKLLRRTTDTTEKTTLCHEVMWILNCSSQDGTCPRDLLQGLVAGTNPLVCADRNTVV